MVCVVLPAGTVTVILPSPTGLMLPASRRTAACALVTVTARPPDRAAAQSVTVTEVWRPAPTRALPGDSEGAAPPFAVTSSVATPATSAALAVIFVEHGVAAVPPYTTCAVTLTRPAGMVTGGATAHDGSA